MIVLANVGELAKISLCLSHKCPWISRTYVSSNGKSPAHVFKKHSVSIREQLQVYGHVEILPKLKRTRSTKRPSIFPMCFPEWTVYNLTLYCRQSIPKVQTELVLPRERGILIPHRLTGLFTWQAIRNSFYQCRKSNWVFWDVTFCWMLLRITSMLHHITTPTLGGSTSLTHVVLWDVTFWVTTCHYCADYLSLLCNFSRVWEKIFHTLATCVETLECLRNANPGR